jgi:enoyl-CoA hydratase/carnithine racemase
VLYEKDGPIGVVSLNRPDMLNAYNIAMRDALFEALCAVRDDPEVRVLILRGNGSAFCTGGDIREFGSAPSPVGARDARWHRDVWQLLLSLPKPTIAAVHGYAVGGGFEIALLCDLCIASTDARFCFPEASMAMIPGVAGTQTAPRSLGVGRALDLVLTCRWLSAGEALAFGVVSKVVSRTRLQAEAIDVAHRLCKLPPQLVSRAKQAVNDGLDLNLVDGLALEQRLNSLMQNGASGEYV